MSKIGRLFVCGVTVIACLSLLLFRLNDDRKASLKLNRSEIPKPLESQSGLRTSLQLPYKCLPNKERKSFAGLLAHWHKLATFYKIPYVICCGSLLGQYRDGDIIPWDEDVDVLVDIEKFKALEAFGEKRNFEQGNDNKFRFVVQQEFEHRKEEDRIRLSCTGKVVDKQMDSCSFISPMGRVIQGYVHLDVFPHVIRKNQGKVHDPDMGVHYNISDFFPFKECVFMNVKTWCPRNVRGVLEDAYDDLKPKYNCVNGKWVRNES